MKRVDTEEYFVLSDYKLKHGNQPHVCSPGKPSIDSKLGEYRPVFDLRETLKMSNALAF